MNGAVSARLPDGRLHLQHGPIDVLVECWAEPAEIEAAYRQAEARFASILHELVGELPRLREPVAALRRSRRRRSRSIMNGSPVGFGWEH